MNNIKFFNYTYAIFIIFGLNFNVFSNFNNEIKFKSLPSMLFNFKTEFLYFGFEYDGDNFGDNFAISCLKKGDDKLIPFLVKDVILNGSKIDNNKINLKNPSHLISFGSSIAFILKNEPRKIYVADHYIGSKISLLYSSSDLTINENIKDIEILSLMAVEDKILVFVRSILNKQFGIIVVEKTFEKKDLHSIIKLKKSSIKMFDNEFKVDSIKSCYDPFLKRIYISYGSYEESKLFMGFLDSNNELILSEFDCGINNIKIDQLKVMHTSTGLDYLIVFGLKSDSDYHLKNNLYIIPLIDKSLDLSENIYILTKIDNNLEKRVIKWTVDSSHGSIFVGDKLSLKKYYKKNLDGDKILDGKSFDEKLNFSRSIIPKNLEEYKIEFDHDLIGKISNIEIHKDSIYFSILKSESNDSSIMFTQAMFDSYGKIKDFTNFKSIHQSSEDILNFHFYAQNCAFVVLKKDLNEYKLSNFSFQSSENNYLSLISKEFEKYNSNINNIFDSFNSQKKEMLIAVGNKLIVIYCEGRIKTYRDPVLDEIGFIESLITLPNSDIFVSGSGGVAILKNNNQNFKKIDSISYISKTILNGDYIYAISPFNLYRLNIKNLDELSNPKFEIIATQNNVNPSDNNIFLDFLVSNKLCLIATNLGLYSSFIDTSNEKLIFDKINFFDKILKVSKLFVVSKSGKDNDVSNKKGGNLYTLTSDEFGQISSVFRFDVSEVKDKESYKNAIKLIDDNVKFNIINPYLCLGFNCDNFYHNGSISIAHKIFSDEKSKGDLFYLNENFSIDRFYLLNRSISLMPLFKDFKFIKSIKYLNFTKSLICYGGSKISTLGKR